MNQKYEDTHATHKEHCFRITHYKRKPQQLFSTRTVNHVPRLNIEKLLHLIVAFSRCS